MATEKRDYKALCEAPFGMESGYEVNFKVLVYTEEKVVECPVFKVMRAKDACKVRKQGRWYWGITCMDEATGEEEWVDYNNCVSLEDWAVLDRLLKRKFGWMELMDPGLVYETTIRAKAQLREGE